MLAVKGTSLARSSLEAVDEGLLVMLMDEVEESRRYLTIHSAPLYRWSEGMLPPLPLQSHSPVRRRCSGQHKQSHQLQHQDATSKDDDEDDDAFLLDESNNSELEKKIWLDSVKSKQYLAR